MRRCARSNQVFSARSGRSPRPALWALLLSASACAGAIDSEQGSVTPEPPKTPGRGVMGAPKGPSPIAGVPGAAGAGSEASAGAPPGGTGGMGVAPTGQPPTIEADCNAVDPGPAPLRRLTRSELNNTLRDLLGDATNPADALPPEELGNGFGNDADALGVSRLLAEKSFEVAKGLALRATADAQKLTGLMGCTPTATTEEVCLRTFLNAFGLRAYRRPMEAVDVDPLVALWKILRAGAAYDVAVRGALTALFQSPPFLYRIELTAPTGAATSAKVAPYEMASRLSYLLWGSMPDAELFAAAKENRLGTKVEIRAQADRLLKDPRAKNVVKFFYDVLFRLEGSERQQKSVTEYPKFVGMAPQLKAETERFLDYVIWEGAGDLKTILSANFSFLNATTAKFYGVTGPKTDKLEKVDLNPAQRAGLLSQGIMASLTTPGAHTNPTIRGVFVMEHLLCAPPPDPPSTLNVMEPKYDPAMTTRERFAVHARDVACAGCHQLMDPIGFGLENYDAIGQWRITENGKPIDSAAELHASLDIAGKFNGPIELSQKLGASDQARRCMVSHWFSYAYGRAETPRDRCSRATIDAAFKRSGYKIRDLLLALTESDAFVHRPAR